MAGGSCGFFAWGVTLALLPVMHLNASSTRCCCSPASPSSWPCSLNPTPNPYSTSCSFQWRDTCHKCGTAKEAGGTELPAGAVGVSHSHGGGAGSGVKPGDWRCDGCGHIK